jgi:hypothetical protein
VPNDGTKEGAVSGASAVVVASLARPAGPAPAGAPVARWLSGATAAAERRVGRGCVREVRVPVPQAGDLVLSPSFVALVRELLAPCGGERDFAAADMRVLAAPPVATAFDRETERRSPLAPWLLGAALALLLAEPLLRRSAARRADADDAASGGADDVGAAA